MAPGAPRRVRRPASSGTHCRPRTSTASCARAVLHDVHPSVRALPTSRRRSSTGAETWGFDLDEVHLTRTGRQVPAGEEAGVGPPPRHACSEDDVVIRNGVRVSRARLARSQRHARSRTSSRRSPSPTACCTAATIDVERLGATDSRRRDRGRRRSTTELVRAPRRSPDRVGRRSLDAVHLFWREHLPRPEPQVEVYDELGRLVATRGLRVGRSTASSLEFDGRLKYVTDAARGRDARRVPASREAPRGADLRADRLGLHPDHLGGPRASANAARPPDPASSRVPARSGRPDAHGFGVVPAASGTLQPTTNVQGYPVDRVSRPPDPYDTGRFS